MPTLPVALPRESMIDWSKYLSEFNFLGPLGRWIFPPGPGAQAAGAAEQVEASPDPFDAASSTLGTYAKDYMEIRRIEGDDCIMNRDIALKAVLSSSNLKTKLN